MQAFRERPPDDPKTGLSALERHTTAFMEKHDGEVSSAKFMTGGGYRLLASANFGELVLACIEARFCKF